jgi:hypothetical protein
MTDPCEVHAQESQRLQPDRLTLTNAEREAIEDASGRYVEGITPKAKEYVATLRGLLERLK